VARGFSERERQRNNNTNTISSPEAREKQRIARRIAFSSKLSRNITLHFRDLKSKNKTGNSTSNHWLK
jgi:hypothetical protein